MTIQDDYNQSPAHINPGTDTTINPVVIDVLYRERKKHPLRCETCDNYDLRDTVQLGEWISVGTCCGKIISDHEVKFVETKGCASHSDIPAHPPDAQQRIDAAIKELKITIRNCESIKGATIDTEGKAFWRGCIAQAKDTIALLQAGRK